MLKLYDDIISACEKELATYRENAELLEYPEVQADKAYYLSVLNKFNAQTALLNKLNELKSSLNGEKEAIKLLDEHLSDSDRNALYGELDIFRENAANLAAELATILGFDGADECVLCRVKFTEGAAAGLAESYASLIKGFLSLHGAKISEDSLGEDISFVANGKGIFYLLRSLAGVCKVSGKSGHAGEIKLAAVYAPAKAVAIDEKDVRIDLFHSHGAGGQNINKVETAVRLTHIPTGTVVTCQDERSQLKNKERAFETLERRINQKLAADEKKRVDGQINRLFAEKNQYITFDCLQNILTDARFTPAKQVPLAQKSFYAYLNSLIAIRK